MSEELLTTPAETPAELEQMRNAPLSVAQVKEQVQRIRDIIKDVMVEGTHYGLIPGTKEKCMYKPGAEILGLTFRLLAEFSTTITELADSHKEYRSNCILRTPSGLFAGQAEGICSTMEKKYRWRGAPGSYEFTGKGVPRAYWNFKNKGDLEAARAQLGGPGFTARKNPKTDDWEVCKMKGGVERDERIENPDLADIYNTCIKMAEKRAHVGAILRVTGASEMFKHEPDQQAGNPDEPKPADEKPKPKPKKKDAKPPPFPIDPEKSHITTEQSQRIVFLMGSRRVDETTWAWWTDAKDNIQSYPEDEARAIIKNLEKFKEKEAQPAAEKPAGNGNGGNQFSP